jgi:hypothetical protein
MTARDFVKVTCRLSSPVVADRAQGLRRAEVDRDVRPIVRAAFEQAERDSIVGTFREFAPALFGGDESAAYRAFQDRSRRLARIVGDYSHEDLASGEIPFRLELASELFDHPRVGMQHLIGVLAGDLFRRSFDDLNGRVEILSLDLGSLVESFRAHFRDNRAHDIAVIREAFRLDRDVDGRSLRLPLTAFSFKPRVGADRETVYNIALGVLRAGFNIVEMNTRNLEVTDPVWFEIYCGIAEAATRIETHVARFSLNLSMAPDIAIDYADRFLKRHNLARPWVAKVDGGIDGLSTNQAVREFFSGAPEDQPIITCYPVLNEVLRHRLGSDGFRELLALSGADIMYPGGAPTVGPGAYIDHDQLERGYERYWHLIERGWPMPSLAGGVHAGQLAAYHEMFGPDVAYFLGGGVALHRNGAVTGRQPPVPRDGTPYHRNWGGAELCQAVLRAAAELEVVAAPNYEALSRRFAHVQDHYVERRNDEEREFYQFQPPARYIRGAVRRYAERRPWRGDGGRQ